jgi:GTPase SAR1 family protein
VEEDEVTVCIWDTAGQEKFFSLTKNYFKKADGVLVVFDLTDKPSFDSKPFPHAGVDKFWVPEIK